MVYKPASLVTLLALAFGAANAATTLHLSIDEANVGEVSII